MVWWDGLPGKDCLVAGGWISRSRDESRSAEIGPACDLPAV